jgi:hypothetical protein
MEIPCPTYCTKLPVSEGGRYKQRETRSYEAFDKLHSFP